MSTFKEKFPELKDKLTVAWFKEIPVVRVKDIEAHCLSKQRVKEFILLAKSNLTPNRHGEYLSSELCFEILEKLLELEQ